MADNDKPQIITPPNTLKAKVSIGGPNAVGFDTLKRAEQVVANTAGSYLEWVEEDLKNISAIFDRLVASSDDRETCLKQVFEVSHDMKGQGGSFSFELITAVASNLCRLLEKFDDSTKHQAQNEAIRIHIDAMKMIISSRMRGDGGAHGTTILDGVQEMVDKLVPTKKGTPLG